MKRRETLRLLPFSFAGLWGMAQRVFPEECNNVSRAFCEKEPLAIRYTKKVRDMLTWIRAHQSENLLEASYAIARTVKNGGQCWNHWDMGHNKAFDLFPERNGEPEIFHLGYDPEKSRTGDLFLVSLYGGSMEEIASKGIFVIGGPAPHMVDNKGDEPLREDIQRRIIRPYADIWIETNITRKGAIMEIPGSTVPLGPTSGIIGLTTFWMMIADACRILARDGISVNVKGDEPPLSDEEVPGWHINSPVSLHDPLMDRYFDTVMDQIEMITAELGKIRKVAKMVVDTVLSGGKVYCYSRYRMSLSVEGYTRRGGLALFEGIFDGGSWVEERPFTSKDCVIMGITKPDDEADLKNFDKFRKAGMKIASIGPQTRDFTIPESRTIPKEVDIHIGSMCDTYGLFAVPGFERKVCPTSGTLVNQLYWATCMEIVEQFIVRTGGDVPGIFANVAIKGGRNQMRHFIELYKDRGY